MVHLPEDVPAEGAPLSHHGPQPVDTTSSQALRESIQRKIQHAEGVLIPTLGARAPTNAEAATATAAEATAAATVAEAAATIATPSGLALPAVPTSDGLTEAGEDWEGDGPMPMEVIARASQPVASSDQADPADPRAVDAGASAEVERDHGSDDETELVLRFELEAGLKDPAAVYTELLRDYSQFLAELEQVAADGQASEDMLKQLDMLDENAHGLLLELDAGVEAITAAASSGTLQLKVKHAELREQAAALKNSVGETLARSQSSFDTEASAADGSPSDNSVGDSDASAPQGVSDNSPSGVSDNSPPPPYAPVPTDASPTMLSQAPTVRDDEGFAVSAQMHAAPRQQQQLRRSFPQQAQRQAASSRQQQKRHSGPSPGRQVGARSRRSAAKVAAEDERLTNAYIRQRSSVRARMAETRSNVVQGNGPRSLHRSALNTRASFNKSTGKREKKKNPKMLTKKMVMQELLLEMHKKWRTMKFVPDSKLNARAKLPSQRSIDALDAGSTLMAPTVSSSASTDPGVRTGTSTTADARSEGGGGSGEIGRSADAPRSQRSVPSANAVRFNHSSARRGGGPPGPPGLARRRPKVATVQRAAELIESRAVKYEQVMDRMNHAYLGDSSGPRVIRKSQLGRSDGMGSPRKKSTGISSASPYVSQVRNPSDPLGIFAKTGGAGRGRATPSFAAPISRGGGSKSSRRSRGGGPGTAAREAPPGSAALSPHSSARGASNSAIRHQRSARQQIVLAASVEDQTGSGELEAVDSPATLEVVDLEHNLTAGDSAETGETDGVEDREALAAAMAAERQQLAQMFDDIDASGASATLEAVALATAKDEADELEQDVEQLKQSIANFNSSKSDQNSRAAGGDGATSGRSLVGINGMKGARGLSDSFNYGQATYGQTATAKGSGSQESQGRSAKQRLNSIKAKQGGVSNMPPMFGMGSKAKKGGPNGAGNPGGRVRRAGRLGEGTSARDGFNSTTSADNLRSSYGSGENGGTNSRMGDDALRGRRVAMKQLKSHGEAARRGGLPPGAKVHHMGKQGRAGAPQARPRVSRSRSDNFAFPIST